MKTIYLGLGSNLGNREDNLKKALALLAPEILVIKVSSATETAPMYNPAQPKFLNMASEAQTSLAPLQVLHKLQSVERSLGREEGTHNQPRPIDLDLLFYETEVIKTPELTIPHPKLAERRFVLEPLAEIASGFAHPIFEATISQLLDRLA